ncbi:MAG: DUF2889 domain-containing protein [Sterolibacterium sp.]|nr:DUF2889 domain-containing protein [Sterolibacterium sp.]
MIFGDDGRELTHTREIVCKAYRRRDSLWEIEGRVSDEKAQEVPFRSRPPVKAGENIHQMSLTLIIDNDFTIQAVQATVSTAPWPECGETETAYRKLVGLRIGPGFSQQVRKLLGGSLACAHLNNLIGELANTYVQASWPDRWARQWTYTADPRHWPDQRTLAFVGQCHAWREGGEALSSEYPELA